MILDVDPEALAVLYAAIGDALAAAHGELPPPSPELATTLGTHMTDRLNRTRSLCGFDYGTYVPEGPILRPVTCWRCIAEGARRERAEAPA